MLLIVQVLEIAKCTPEDIGKYTLLAENTAGEATTVANLDVVGKRHK